MGHQNRGFCTLFTFTNHENKIRNHLLLTVTSLHHDLAQWMTSVFADERPHFVESHGEVPRDAHYSSLGDDVEGDKGTPEEQLKGVERGKHYPV